MNETRPLIELVDIRRTYPMGAEPVHALRGISLRIYPNEYVAIMALRAPESPRS